MGFFHFLNDNASAIGVIFAALSGCTLIIAFIWKIALRYQKIEDKLVLLDSNIEDKFNVLQKCLDLRLDGLEEKIDLSAKEMSETVDEVKIAFIKIAVIESQLSRSRK